MTFMVYCGYLKAYANVYWIKHNIYWNNNDHISVLQNVETTPPPPHHHQKKSIDASFGSQGYKRQGFPKYPELELHLDMTRRPLTLFYCCILNIYRHISWFRQLSFWSSWKKSYHSFHSHISTWIQNIITLYWPYHHYLF